MIILVTFICILVTGIFASPNYISDVRIRDPDMALFIGRGFSMASFSVVSTCLKSTEKTQPTYNYEYDTYDVEENGHVSSSSGGSLSASLGYSFVKATISDSFSDSKVSKKKSRHVITVMKMERYYSSMDDSTATFSSGAQDLLDQGDTIGFFQACGSGYIRTIRRTAEITAVFSLTSESDKELSESALALSMSLKGWGAGMGAGGSLDLGHKSNSKKSSVKTETTILIRAYGLGLNSNGSDTLVAKNIEDYHNVIAFAFRSMHNDEVGVVQGIEVVNWVNCLQFQQAVKFREGLEQLSVISLKSEASHTETFIKEVLDKNLSTTLYRERLENAQKAYDDAHCQTDEKPQQSSPIEGVKNSSKKNEKPSEKDNNTTRQEECDSKNMTLKRAKATITEFEKNLSDAGLSSADFSSGALKLVTKNENDSESSRMYRGIPTGISLTSLALKSISHINSEFIAYIEDKYKSKVRNAITGYQCRSMLEYYVKQGLGERNLEEKKEMKLQFGQLMGAKTGPASTVQSLYGVLDNDKLAQNMANIKKFMFDFYAPCVTAMNAASSEGIFTRYYFELESCDIKKMEEALNALGKYGFDPIIESYCLPELLPITA